MKHITKKTYIRLRRKQQLFGVGMLLFCILILWICSKGSTPEERDCAVVFLLAPTAIYMIFSKELIYFMDEE